MSRLELNGLSADLPAGFEGRIFQRPNMGGAQAEAVMQVATFALPAGTGDFGGGATPMMRDDDIFAVLFEYGQESIGKALFSHVGVPIPIPIRLFGPFTLRRGVPNQAGTQLFFTERGRPFTLYVVIGSFGRRNALVPRVNELLARIEIAERPTAPRATAGVP